MDHTADTDSSRCHRRRSQGEHAVKIIDDPRGSHPDRTAVLEQRVVDMAVERWSGSDVLYDQDLLAVEEALEIRLVYGVAHQRTRKTISVTMRTPGNDLDLAVGFLFAEGLVRCPEDVRGMQHCGPPAGSLRLRNVVRVELRPEAKIDTTRLERNFLSTSSCGVCGKASIEALPALRHTRLPDGFVVAASMIHELPDRLRRSQMVFDSTGGLHAAALFDRDGRLHDVKEDVGRHNALDKLVGRQFLNGMVPLNDRVLLVSGRVGYELVQKAIAAGISILAAVGAPSSLAADLAKEANMTLVGFVRDGRFNVYSAAQRICDQLDRY